MEVLPSPKSQYQEVAPFPVYEKFTLNGILPDCGLAVKLALIGASVPTFVVTVLMQELESVTVSE